jgi:RND family efflux transporter MFP subunit
MKVLYLGCWLAFSVVLLDGCRSKEAAPSVAVQTVQASVVESRQQALPLTIRATGTVRARQTAILSAQVTGRILQVLVCEGDAVRAGQTLVVIDGAALRASAAQAQAGVKAVQSELTGAQTEAKLAASTLERYRQLQAQKSVSSQEMDEVAQRAAAASARLDAVRAQTESARAQEEGAHTMLGYSRLVAPFAGTVTARMVDAGTMASPGVPLLQIDQAGVLQLGVSVDESAINVIHKGMKSKVAIDAVPSTEITGTVSEIDPTADPASHSFLVKIDLPSPTRLRAGTYGTAEFTQGVRQAIVIPQSGVASRGSLACAYVLDNQEIAHFRYLTLGAKEGSVVEVLSGLSPGERVVDGPSDRELDGKRIEVRQ